jgi:hypothetical protein
MKRAFPGEEGQPPVTLRQKLQVRWGHPERGLVYIPLIDNGFYLRIGRLQVVWAYA